MTRVRIDINVFGDTHPEILRKIRNSLINYLELREDFIGDIAEYVEMEIEVSNADLEDGYEYKAIAYCKLKK
jgi:hypothetical protein